MKWLIIIVGGLIVLIVLIAIIGAFLPRDHVATVRATIPATPTQVWAAITDASAYPTWRGVKKVDVLSTNPLSWREENSQGAMTLTADVFEPPRRMVARIKDEGEPFGGAWEYLIEPAPGDPNKSNVAITERGWVSNPIFRFVSKFVMGQHSTLEAYMKQLGRKFGAEVTPVRA